MLLWLGLGRIAGISGIVGGLLTAAKDDRAWRICFLLGLMGAPVLVRAWGGEVPQATESSWSALSIAGGFLVGLGSRMGSGCTSGHGVCGIARLSWRSMAATAVFMTTAVVTAMVVHLLGLR